MQRWLSASQCKFTLTLGRADSNYARANPRNPRTTIESNIPIRSRSFNTFYQIITSRLISNENARNPSTRTTAIIPAQSQKPHCQDHPGSTRLPASRNPVCRSISEEKKRHTNPKFQKRPLGTADVHVLIFINKYIAVPRPCRARKTINWIPIQEKPAAASETVIMKHPLRPTVRLPIRSATLPERRKQYPLARLKVCGSVKLALEDQSQWREAYE